MPIYMHCQNTICQKWNWQNSICRNSDWQNSICRYCSMPKFRLPRYCSALFSLLFSKRPLQEWQKMPTYLYIGSMMANLLFQPSYRPYPCTSVMLSYSKRFRNFLCKMKPGTLLGCLCLDYLTQADVRISVSSS